MTHDTLTTSLLVTNDMQSALSDTGTEECGRNITWARDWTTEESARRILPRETYFSFVHSVQTGSGIHAALYSHGTGGALSHVDKAHGSTHLRLVSTLTMS